jgi:hypothetical protein
MALALPSPRHLVSLAALASVLAACPKPDDPELDDGSGAPDDPDTTGTSAPNDTAGVLPTTGDPGDSEPTSTTTGENSTSGQGPSDSTSEADTGTTEPDFGQCPYEPGGVEITLARVEKGVTTDLGARECGALEQFTGLQVIAAAGDHLEAAVCADATCGACEPAATLALALALPDGLVGLPAQLAAGDCLRLDVEWSRAGADPQQCAVGGLAVVGLRGGQPEPVPHPSTEALWDAALTDGARLFAVATDDAHHYDDAPAATARGETAYTGDRGFVVVHAARELPAIRAALLAGEFYASTGLLLNSVSREGGALTVEAAQAGVTIEFVGAGGEVLRAAPGPRATMTLAETPGPYLRARVRGADGRKAWTQPIWRE